MLEHLANQADHDRAQKRGGGRTPISIDRLTAERRYGCEPAHSLTAERLFERQWALALLDKVLEAMKYEMTRAGKERQFEALRPALLGVASPKSTVDDKIISGTAECGGAAPSSNRGRGAEITGGSHGNL